MGKAEKPSSDMLDKAEKDAKTIAKAGPPGVLLITMLILLVIAIVVLGIMLLGSRG